jgi:hypothetical protein
MHPQFGAKTQQEILEELQEEEARGEIDMNLRAYKETRMMARRSPYPTLVLEVKATPSPIDFGERMVPTTITTSQEEEEEKITTDDIQKLEALFGKSAALHVHESDRNDEDDFYNAISNTMGIEEISLVTPMILAQNWIVKNDADKFNVETSAFTVSDASHVDEGYEFVFVNVAMQESKLKEMTANHHHHHHQRHSDDELSFEGMRQYLVMNNFLTSSATSLEKFAHQVQALVDVLPGLVGKLTVETFHPEHIDKARRGPVPIVVLDWKPGAARHYHHQAE